MTLIEFAGQVGGIAGVLAVIMFLVYRQDRIIGAEVLVRRLV